MYTHTIIIMFDSLLVLFFVDPETLKFRDVERRFVKQFQMPQEEKLVNCNSIYFILFYYSFSLFAPDYACSYWKGSLPRQGWLYLSVNHLCFYSFLMGSVTTLIVRWSDVKVMKSLSLSLPL